MRRALGYLLAGAALAAWVILVALPLESWRCNLLFGTHL